MDSNSGRLLALVPWKLLAWVVAQNMSILISQYFGMHVMEFVNEASLILVYDM